MPRSRRDQGATAAVAPWVPPFHAAVPRQAQPGQVLEETDARGVRRSITADANGIVWPTSPADVELADAHRLPALTSWGNPDDAGAGAETDDDETDETGADAGQED